MRDVRHTIKVATLGINPMGNTPRSSYENFGYDFESTGMSITADHNDLHKKGTSGKGTGTKPKSSGRKKYTGEPTIDFCNHKCISSERDPHAHMDEGLEITQVLMECK